MFWLTIALFAVFVLVLVSAIFSLFKKKEPERAKATLKTCLFYVLLFLSVLIFRLDVPFWVLLLTMAATFISGFWGQYLKLYNRSRVFDRYLHAYGAFSFALLGFYLLNQFLQVGGSRLSPAVFTFTLGNTIGVLFELLEFHQDQKQDSSLKCQHGLKDTDMDMLFNLFGSAAAGICIYFIL